MFGGPHVHNEVNDFQREIAVDSMNDEVASGMVTFEKTPARLHRMRVAQRLERERHRVDTSPIALRL